MTRRTFIRSVAGAGLCSAVPRAFGAGERPLRFLFMTDHHVESDFLQSHGLSAGEPVYTMWKPGNHAAIARTYAFVNRDPFCSGCDFALFGGDQLNTGYTKNRADMEAERANYDRLLAGLDLHAKTLGKTADFDFTAAPFEIHRDRADVHVYARAVAEERGGKTVFTAEPHRIGMKSIPLASSSVCGC